MAITKFLAVMAKKKNHEWTDIKELMPLQFMPYVAKLFREVTGQDLSGLGHFTGWIGLGGYYHWRVAQQGLIHLVPHLAGQSMPRTPDARPSGPSQTGVNQPPVGADRNPPRARVDSCPPPARAERSQPPGKVESHPLPARVVDRPPQMEVGPQQPQEVLPTVPQGGKEPVTGTICTCTRCRVRSLSPQCLHTRSGRQKRGRRPLVTFMTE